MADRLLKVAAYARISTDKDDQANSLESQKRYFADYIRTQQDWTLTEVYFDEGISGTQSKNRAGFQSMIASALSGGIDLILTKEVCRFARNTVDTLTFTRRLKERGVGVIFTIDHIDTREPDGELRLTIMACLAQEESRKTSERVKWGQKRRMEQGVVFGRDLLGYTVQNGTLTVNEAEAPIVRSIFHKYTDEGKGTHVIARELTEAGIQTKRISRWSNTTILRILRNEKYIGDLCQKKTITPDFLTHAKKYNHGEEEQVYCTDHHEPIISRELWNRTQKELLRRCPAKEQKTRYSSRYWCSGKIRCAICGSCYISRTKKRKDGTYYHAWRCRCNAIQDSTARCTNRSIQERCLLSCVGCCITLLLPEPAALQKELQAELKQLEACHKPTDRQRPAHLPQEEISRLQEKKRRAVDLMLEGLISKKELQKQIGWYDEKIEAAIQNIQTEKAGASNDHETPAAEISEKLNVPDACEEIFTRLANGAEGCEHICQEVLEYIVIHPGYLVDVHLKGVPFMIRLTVKSSGRTTQFHTQITEAACLPLCRAKDTSE